MWPATLSRMARSSKSRISIMVPSMWMSVGVSSAIVTSQISRGHCRTGRARSEVGFVRPPAMHYDPPAGKETLMPEKSDLFEIIQTTRAMRRLKPDRVPDELIRKILEAGVCAANGGNTPRWRFLVLKVPKIKKQAQVYYKKAFDEVVGPRY